MPETPIEDTREPGMRPADIALLAAAGEVVLAPDGRRAAYILQTVDLAANAYRTRLWMVATDGGPPLPLAGQDATSLPRWSGDGRMLAWVAARETGAEICVLAVDGPGEAVVVSTWPDAITELAWSPNGRELAFVGRTRDASRYGPPGTTTKAADMPPRRVTRLLSRLDGDGWVYDRPTQVYVVPVDRSAPPRALTSGEAPAVGVAWSPDGERLAYVAGTHERWDLDGRRDLWVIDSTGGVATRQGDAPVAWSLPSWSPDGACIAGLVEPSPLDGPRHAQLWVHDVARGTSTRWATGLDRNLSPYGASRAPVWAGDELLVAVDDHGRVHLRAAGRPSSPGGDEPRLVVGGDRLVRSYDASAGTVAFVASSAREPGEVWAGELTGAGIRRLSDHGGALRSRVRLVAPERFTARSADGTEVECWALAPPGATGANRHPAVLNIHGGPFAQYGDGFFDEFQLQVGAGLGVLACNPRGSSGYEEAWGRAIRWPEAAVDPGSGWGGVDYDDVMACTEEAVRRFAWIDPDRLGVQGGSYGGYLSSWIVGHTDRFCAAVSERAVNNLVTMEHNSDISGFFKEYVGWSHLERPELYVRHSPATAVADMTTPLLIVHSEDDLRCPIAQAEELFVALRLLGRHAELVRFPGEGHELSRSGSPRHRVMRAEIILDWFARHLQPGPAAV
jgi:dipeptidyl aminopeptidase/acylaminoacyl peptidase